MTTLEPLFTPAENLACAVSAVEYFQAQYDTKPNWYTESPLHGAKITLQQLEG